MARQAKNRGNRNGTAKTPRQGPALPAEIAALVNPRVYEERQRQVERRLADEAAEADRRRRYLRTIIEHHLWKELKNA